MNSRPTSCEATHECVLTGCRQRLCRVNKTFSGKNKKKQLFIAVSCEFSINVICLHRNNTFLWSAVSAIFDCPLPLTRYYHKKTLRLIRRAVRPDREDGDHVLTYYTKGAHLIGLKSNQLLKYIQPVGELAHDNTQHIHYSFLPHPYIHIELLQLSYSPSPIYIDWQRSDEGLLLF